MSEKDAIAKTNFSVSESGVDRIVQGFLYGGKRHDFATKTPRNDHKQHRQHQYAWLSGDQASLRSFPELLIQQMNAMKLPVQHSVRKRTSMPIGTLNTGVYVQDITPNFRQGTLRETQMSTDLAIVDGIYPDETGSVFFTVQNEAGQIRYTRNGNFTIDGQGYLTTSEGYYVLDQQGTAFLRTGWNLKSHSGRR